MEVEEQNSISPEEEEDDIEEDNNNRNTTDCFYRNVEIQSECEVIRFIMAKKRGRFIRLNPEYFDTTLLGDHLDKF